MLKHYPINIFFDERDNLWVAISDDLPGCSAGGATPQEALAEFEVAVEAWLEARAAAGLEIPEPTLRRASACKFEVIYEKTKFRH